MGYPLPFLVSLVVGVFLLPMMVSVGSLYPVRRYARRLGLLDRPGGHSSHETPTPLGGGIGIYAGLLVTFALATVAVYFASESAAVSARLPEGVAEILPSVWSRFGKLWAILGCGTVLLVLGLVDDRFGLSPWLRLGVQFAVASVAVLGLEIGLTAHIGIPLLTSFLSMVWIVALINSFNMLDNMDGLSGGVAAIIAAAMAVVMLMTPDPGTSNPQLLVAIFLVAVCGSLLGFLWHNLLPARIFMGDGGSYLVGFMIAVATLLATFASNAQPRPHAVLCPLCAMAVPLYDMATVLWIRLRQGRSLFQGDHSHFSHRLHALGLSRLQAVLTIYLVTGTCGLAAILLTQVTIWQAATVLGIVVCMLLLVVILESTGWQKRDSE